MVHEFHCIGWSMLPIRIQADDDLVPVVARPLEPGLQCGTLSAVRPMTNDRGACAGCAGRGPVGRSVVDHDHRRFGVSSELTNDRCDGPFGLKSRDHVDAHLRQGSCHEGARARRPPPALASWRISAVRCASAMADPLEPELLLEVTKRAKRQLRRRLKDVRSSYPRAALTRRSELITARLDQMPE